MAESLKEAQEALVKLFRDVYFRAGAPLRNADELRVRSTVETIVTAIRDEVIARMPPPAAPPKPAEPQGASGDPFSQPRTVPAHAAAKPTPEPPPKRGFFGMVKSQTVPDPHKKK